MTENLKSLAQHWQMLLAEYRAIAGELVPWHERSLYNSGWDVFGLVHCGDPLPLNQTKCPQTTALLNSMDGIFMAGFSVLRPGTLIYPHTGYTDEVMRGHVGLDCPKQCGLWVGDDHYQWNDGEAFEFDDTQLHSAYNSSLSDRVIFIMDTKK